MALTALAAALRLGMLGLQSAVDAADDLLPVLIAAGFLCVVGLAWRRHRSMAWLATIGTAFVLTIDIATYAREVRPDVDAVTWQWLGIAVSLAALLAVATAAAYGFGRPRFRRGRLGVEATLVVVLIFSLVGGWVISNPDELAFFGRTSEGLGSLGLITRTFLVLTPVFTALGIVGDLLPPAERAWRRVTLIHRGSTSRAERISAWARAFADEIAPGRTRARRAVLAERSRVARDLHADVVPGLRRALVDAERGVANERLAASLRVVLADLEAAGSAQHPIQLEIGGLVAALEWLAERVHGWSGVEVSLDVEDPPQDAGEPPEDVAAGAFRVAANALSNVAWHAPGCPAFVAVRAEGDRVEMTIRDEGPGIAPEALEAARTTGRRGIADMAAEAAACGATVDIEPGPDGVGTVVTFRWRSAAAD